MSRLVVVSNRIAPIHRKGSGGEGGLAVAVLAALKAQGGIWFGWSGQISESESSQAETIEFGKLTCATIDLSQRDYDEYYNGFANGTLWPLFHYRQDLVSFNRAHFLSYLRVNTLFASRLRPLLREDDVIWVHDYHLVPLAEQLRNAGCEQRIGFFLHIPWPAYEVFLTLPNHQAIARSLCAYNLVGFQTERDVTAFLDYIREEAGGEVLDGKIVKAFGRTLQVGAFPISIDTGAVAKMAEEAAGSRQTERLKESVGDRELIIGVDRLDYTKGLVHRVAAFGHLLQVYPSNRGRVVLLQIAPPSRSDVLEYKELRQELESVAGHVNGTFSEYDWVPVRYLNKGFRHRTLAGFYRISRVALVTPLRDGMNLVAKEYVAAQSPEDPGVLVLSRFAGAARELSGALIVNPYDIEGMAEALEIALTMPKAERRERWEAMFKRLRQFDITAWRESYLDALSAAAA
ncbi:MAG: alpha,alpha-trehalose-phosphate synthase (UDP-forming) [Rhodospirillales bacterium]|nr:alpha,alpha-trehalose-phosphate synthase (UDP-forming) [Rhodospirillales bacterium]